MKTKSFAKSLTSVLLAAMMLLSLIPMSAMAATTNKEGNITSTTFTLSNYAYGNTVISAMAVGEKSVAYVHSTKFYESAKDAPNAKSDFTETADSFFQAGKQYYCGIDFSEHSDLFDPNNADNNIYFDRALTATLTNNGVACEEVFNESGNSKLFIFKLPVLEATPFGIDVTTVIEQGGNVAPKEGNFELEILNAEIGSNSPIADFTFGGTKVTTNGKGSFDSKLTVVNNDYEKTYFLLYEGILVRQKKGFDEGWTYDEAVWCVAFHQDVAVNALTDEVETMPDIKFDCLKGKLVDGIFEPDDSEAQSKITFTNIYTENVTTVKIPFVKKVTLGGDITPTAETFRLELFDIGNSNTEEYVDVTYTAEVATNGKGEYKGEIVITGPSSRLEAYLSEGFFVREVKGNAADWTYSDAVWCVIPEWNEQQEKVFVVYPAEKEGDFYRAAEKAADQMVFTNVYTKNAAPKTGDNSNAALCLALLLVSALGIAGITVIGKKRAYKA